MSSNQIFKDLEFETAERLEKKSEEYSVKAAKAILHDEMFISTWLE